MSPRGRPIRKFPLTAFDRFLTDNGVSERSRQLYRIHVRALFIESGAGEHRQPTTEQLAAVLAGKTMAMQSVMKSAWNRWREFQQMKGHDTSALPDTSRTVRPEDSAKDIYMAELCATLGELCWMLSIPIKVFACLRVRHLVIRRWVETTLVEEREELVLNALGLPCKLYENVSTCLMRLLEMQNRKSLFPDTPLICNKQGDAFSPAFISRVMSEWWAAKDIGPKKRRWEETTLEQLSPETFRTERDVRYAPLPASITLLELMNRFYEGGEERYRYRLPKARAATFNILNGATINEWLGDQRGERQRSSSKTAASSAGSSNEEPELESPEKSDESASESPSAH